MSIFKRLKDIAKAELASRLSREQSWREEPARDCEDDWPRDERSEAPSIENEYYANLELPPGSSFEEVKRAYRRLLKKYHPDKHFGKDVSEHAEKISQRLNEAYHYFEKKHENKRKN